MRFIKSNPISKTNTYIKHLSEIDFPILTSNYKRLITENKIKGKTVYCLGAPREFAHENLRSVLIPLMASPKDFEIHGDCSNWFDFRPSADNYYYSTFDKNAIENAIQMIPKWIKEVKKNSIIDESGVEKYEKFLRLCKKHDELLTPMGEIRTIMTAHMLCHRDFKEDIVDLLGRVPEICISDDYSERITYLLWSLEYGIWKKFHKSSKFTSR